MLLTCLAVVQDEHSLRFVIGAGGEGGGSEYADEEEEEAGKAVDLVMNDGGRFVKVFSS